MDFDEILGLMHLAQKAKHDHPDLPHIHRHALHRLREINRDLADKPTDEGTPQLSPVPQPARTTIGEPGRATTTGVAVEQPNPNANADLAAQHAQEEEPRAEGPTGPSGPTDATGPTGPTGETGTSMRRV